MITFLHQLSLPEIVIGALFIFGVLAWVQHWALQRLNAEPAEELDSSSGDKDSEILGDVPVRSKVGTPRQRRLQPLRAGDEPAMASSLSGSGGMVPTDSLAHAGGSVFAKAKEAAGTGKPAPFGVEGSPQQPFAPAKLGRLVLSAESKVAGDKPVEPTAKPIVMPPLAPEVAGIGGKALEPIIGSTALPPLSINVPVTGTSKDVPSARTPAIKPSGAKEPPVIKPAESTPIPAALKPPFVPDKPAAVPPAVPVAEKLADGIVAVGQPVPLASAPAEPQAASTESDDVKKRKTSPAGSGAKPGDAGLIIIPKAGEVVAEAVPAVAASPAEPVKAAETPAAPPPETKTESPSKVGSRPRIFLPANLPVPAAKPSDGVAPVPASTGVEKPVVESVTPVPANVTPVVPVEVKTPVEEVPVKVEEVPAKVEEVPVKIEAKEVTPAAIPIPEIKPQAEPELAAPEARSLPAAAPESVVTPPSALVEKPADPVPTKVDAPAPVEPAKPEAQTAASWLRGILRRSDAEEPAKPPVLAPAAKAEEAKPVESDNASVSSAPAAKVEEAKPAATEEAPVPVIPEAEVKAPVPSPDVGQQVSAAEKKISVEPAPAAGAKPVPGEASPVPTPAPILPAESKPVPATPTPEVSVRTSQPTMAQNESTTNVPANSRASAQLTLGFEITSLQLTPFFKLGAVQLRPLSKVVGLHLIATQTADNPLAAGISFEIDKVELGEGSKIRSILLKPLGDAQAATVPQANLQVGAVQIGQGGDGAPISITSADKTSSAVQLLATFTIAAMDFTPAFEIGSLRLEPTSNSVLLRLAPSSRPAALDLPPSFEIASVQIGEDAQISALSLMPGSKPA